MRIKHSQTELCLSLIRKITSETARLRGKALKINLHNGPRCGVKGDMKPASAGIRFVGEFKTVCIKGDGGRRYLDPL